MFRGTGRGGRDSRPGRTPNTRSLGKPNYGSAWPEALLPHVDTLPTETWYHSVLLRWDQAIGSLGLHSKVTFSGRRRLDVPQPGRATFFIVSVAPTPRLRAPFIALSAVSWFLVCLPTPARKLWDVTLDFVPKCISRRKPVLPPGTDPQC